MASNINPNLQRILDNIRISDFSPDEYFREILKGNRLFLSKAITLLESRKPEHQKLSAELIEKILPYTGKSKRIGITGVPGVGKSTFINAFGKLILSQGHKLAILAIDPSSQISKGSILGDKNRMPDIAGDDRVFIRPSPNAGFLGGVAAKTRETILLCEAAGYDVIIVETVGVGQSETAVASMTDMFLLLLASGTGDDLQGIKRGIMEMADLLIFTKYDGQNKTKIDMEKRLFKNVLRLFPPKQSGWKPDVTEVSAIENFGIENVWSKVNEFFDLIRKNGYLEKNRQKQRVKWFYETFDFLVKTYLRENFEAELHRIEKQIEENKIYPFSAARQLLEKFFSEAYK